MGNFERLWRPHVLPSLDVFAQAVSAKFPLVPIIAFPKGQPLAMPVDSKFSAISVGWTDNRETCVSTFQRSAVPSVEARQPLAPEYTDKPNATSKVLALQGNLDPQVLYASDEAIIEETRKMVSCKSADLGKGGEVKYAAHQR